VLNNIKELLKLPFKNVVYCTLLAGILAASVGPMLTKSNVIVDMSNKTTVDLAT